MTIRRLGGVAATLRRMDAHTLEKLEFERIRQLVAEQAQCALGRDLASRIAPSRSAGQVAQWLDQAKQFEAFAARHGMPPFGGITDLRAVVKRAVPPAKLEPEEFSRLSDTLRGAANVRRYFEPLEAGAALVRKLADRIGDFAAVIERIDAVIDARGRVRDDASARLARLRRDIDDVRLATRNVFDRLLRQPGVLRWLQYPNATFHADRMVLPLRAEQRGRIPGIVHRSSDSGQTLFVEPAEAVELNNRLMNLLQDESDEINRILWELTHLVHLNQAELLRTLETLAVVDLLAAKQRFAARWGMAYAVLNTAGRLKLIRARNPILLAMFGAQDSAGTGEAIQSAASRSVVPIDVRLGDDLDILMITGPNTGGKTAALKTVGLISLMHQAGLPIPAATGSEMPVFDGIWIDVGDEQSLQQSLSTFSAHLARILDILRRARKGTLVLLDELGAGTDPDEGAAIGRAIIDHLLHGGCLAMITTHLGALKAVGYDHPRVDNASVQFDIESLRPTYELRIGEPGHSSAITIATKLGMPRKLADAARKHLAGRHRALHRAIAGTLQSRRDAERARRDADAARSEAAKAALTAVDIAKKLAEQKSRYAAWVERVMRLQPGDAVFVRRFDKPGRVVRIKLDRQQAVVAMDSMEAEVPLADLTFAE